MVPSVMCVACQLRGRRKNHRSNRGSPFKKCGKEKGHTEIMNPKRKLRKGKLFTAANDRKGVVLSSVVRSEFVGRNHYG